MFFSGNVETNDFIIETFTPEIIINSDYEGDGKILSLDVHGNGPSQIIFRKYSRWDVNHLYSNNDRHLLYTRTYENTKPGIKKSYNL